MKKIQLNTKQFRQVESVELRKIDAADQESDSAVMEFSFSSEVPYERYYGYEIISHDKGAMNLERLNSRHPLLFNHDMDAHLGVIEKAWIGDDRRGHVRVRFGSSALAKEKQKDVEDGILSLVSFGYMIDEMKMTKDGGGKAPDEYTVTKCLPFEVSFVTIPADYSVGVGRKIEGEKEITVEAPPSAEELEAIEIEKQNKLTASDKAAKEGKQMEIDIQVSDAVKAERARVKAIDALAEKYGHADLARQLKEGEKSIQDAEKAYLDKIGATQKPVTGSEAVVGLDNKEIERFSFLKVINALSNPHDQSAQKAASFERAMSVEAEKKYGKTSRGFMVPFEVLAHSQKRDLVVGTASAGGNLVATDLKADSFIELLRNKMVIARAGATVFNGLQGMIAIPRATGSATAYHVGENAAPTESAPAFDQVTMGPKTIAGYVDYSRRLSIQSSLDIENFIKGDLAKVLGLGIDAKALYGSGSSNQPTGLQLVSGIGSVEFGANAPSYAEMVALETEITADNAEASNMCYLVNARGRGILKGVEKASSTGQFVWEPGNTVNGYRCEVSNQISQVSTGKEHYWFGNFADMILGFWSGLDLMVDPYTGSKEGTVRIVAMQDYDVAVRHPESFALGFNS